MTNKPLIKPVATCFFFKNKREKKWQLNIYLFFKLNHSIRCIFQSCPLTSSQWHRCFWGAVEPAGSCPPPCPRRAGGGRWCTGYLCSAGVAAVGAQHPPRWPSWCAQKTPSAPPATVTNPPPQKKKSCAAELLLRTSNHFLASITRKWKRTPSSVGSLGLGRTADALCLFDDKEPINRIILFLYIVRFYSAATLAHTQVAEHETALKKKRRQKTEVRVSWETEICHLLLVKVFGHWGQQHWCACCIINDR